MSAPQIPPLNTLPSPLLQSDTTRSRHRPARKGQEEVDESSEAAKDKIVQQTDHDASISRLSAVERGYLDDPFASLFLPEDDEQEKEADERLQQRRFPIINRGTYVRTSGIDLLVKRFLGEGKDAEQGTTTKKRKRQIISLGAGSDTRYFRLAASSSSSSSPSMVYHELDFPTNTAQKIASIQRSDELRSVLRGHHDLAGSNDTNPIQISPDFTALYSPTYNIHPIDLRSLQPLTEPSKPALPNLDPDLPTLLISECCLIYLTPSTADSILKYFTTHLFPPSTPLGIIIYEPIKPSDSFGQVMVQNLGRRGIVMQTLKKYGSLNRQKERLRLMGFESGQASADVDFVWENWISPREISRVANLELLDEVEEWRLLAGHYCLAWGWRDDDDDDDDGNLMTEGKKMEREIKEDVFGAWREHVLGQINDE